MTITGTNLGGATAVDFGTNPATITADTAGSITATSPAGTGTVDVTVTTAGGTSATSPADRFTYTVASGPSVTGISPTIGTNRWRDLRHHHRHQPGSATAVHFGANTAT